MQQITTFILLFLFVSCSDIIEDKDIESLIRSSNPNSNNTPRGELNFDVSKLDMIEKLNPNFSLSFIIQKNGDHTINISKTQVKDLFGNVVEEKFNNIHLFQTKQYQTHNFMCRINKFHTTKDGNFSKEEQAFLENVFRRFRKIFAHPFFRTYLNNSNISVNKDQVYDNLKNNAKDIRFFRKQNINMTANGSRISIGTHISFDGDIKPIQQLGYQIASIYGYDYQTGVNQILEKFIRDYYEINTTIPDYPIYDLNDFGYDVKIAVDAPLHNTWVLDEYKKKENNELNNYGSDLPTHPTLTFHLIDGERTFTGSNGNSDIHGIIDNLTYSELRINEINKSQNNNSTELSNQLDLLLKSATTYEIDNNILVFKDENQKKVLIYRLKTI